MNILLNESNASNHPNITNVIASERSERSNPHPYLRLSNAAFRQVVGFRNLKVNSNKNNGMQSEQNMLLSSGYLIVGIFWGYL
jgi:hypothetical protein